MTLLTLLQSGGDLPPPPPPADAAGRSVVRRPVVLRRPERPPVPVRAFAPGVAILVPVGIVTGRARGAAAARGFAASSHAAHVAVGAARGAARAQGAALRQVGVAQAGAVRVEPRLSLDEFAALLLAAR